MTSNKNTQIANLVSVSLSAHLHRLFFGQNFREQLINFPAVRPSWSDTHQCSRNNAQTDCDDTGGARVF